MQQVGWSRASPSSGSCACVPCQGAIVWFPKKPRDAFGNAFNPNNMLLYVGKKKISRAGIAVEYFFYGEHFCCFCLNVPCISWVFQLSSERICQLLKRERQISWIALPYQHSRWSASSTCNVLYILWRVDTHHISRRRCHTAQTRSYLPKLSFFFKENEF